MSAAKSIQEGTYKICFDHGCLTALRPNEPLRILPDDQSEHQKWELKKHGQNEFLMLCKKDPKMGVSYRKDPFPGEPVISGESPRPFKIVPTERGDHYRVIPAESEERLDMAQSPALVFPPLVAMMPEAMPFFWRFERS
ncbi:hypothetical protein NDA16_003022 [Ustilago loliicola]|nr:hypothetical protein NDA16_003022 [Ustilago loliicola]